MTDNETDTCVDGTDRAPTVYLPDGTPVKVRLIGAECMGDCSGEGHFGYSPPDLNGEEPTVYFEEVRSADTGTEQEGR